MVTVFQELSKTLKSEKGKLYAVKCDVSNESDVQAAFKWVKDNLGGVDILVNNAAVAYDTSLISKSPYQLSGLNLYRSLTDAIQVKFAKL
jgi:NAD(P)-dependent dehydrogenase (short-subunit alcohol dehydrogenase family)